MNKNEEKIWELSLNDPATVSFCTFSKGYYGTKEEINEYLQVLEEDPGTREVYWELRKVRSAMAGYRLIDRQELILENKEWSHMNIWDCEYRLKASRIEISQLLLEGQGEFLRCIRPVFYDLMSYNNYWKEWRAVPERFWGSPKILYKQDEKIGTRLYIRINRYNSLDEALPSLFDADTLDFKKVCDEIFGDG